MTEKDLDSSNNKYIEKSKPNDKQSEWDIAIGLQRVDNLKPSKYLKKISEEKLIEMNNLVNKLVKINDAVLTTDYFKNIKNETKNN